MAAQARNHTMIDRLRTERDELRVRMHLARAELREGFNALEKKWERLERHLAEARAEAKDASREVRAAAGQLAAEIASACRRIGRRLH